MNTRFFRFLLGAILFFSAITDFAIQSHTIYGFQFTIPLFIRGAFALSGAYLMISVVQKSNDL